MPTRPVTAQRHADQVGAQVARPDAGHDGHAAHRRRTALLGMAGRPVLADLMAESTLGEQPDQRGGQQDRDRQRDTDGDEDEASSVAAPICFPLSETAIQGLWQSAHRQGRPAPPSWMPSPAPHLPAAAPPATRPARHRRRRPSWTPDPHEPSITAPWCMAFIVLPVPTTINRDTSSAPRSVRWRRARPWRPRRVRPSRPTRPNCGAFPRRGGGFIGAPTGHPRQRLQPRTHRIGVGVIGIVDHRHTIGAGGDLHPAPRDRAGARQRRGDLIQAGAALQRHRRRAQRVADLMIAVYRERHLNLLVARVQGETRARQIIEGDRAGPHVDLGAGLTRHPHHAGRGRIGHRRHRSVVDVEDHHTRGRNSLRQFGFGSRDGFARAELAEVGSTHVEHHRDLGGAIAARAAILPGCRADISRIR